MSDKTDMWGWACVTIIVVSAVTSLTYYNITAPSGSQLAYEHKEKKLKFQETMVKQYSVSPAVLECLERDWDNVSVYQICKEVLSNQKITQDEAARLVEKVKELDK